MILDAESDMTVIGEAEDGRSAVDIVRAAASRRRLMDIRMPR